MRKKKPAPRRPRYVVGVDADTKGIALYTMPIGIVPRHAYDPPCSQDTPNAQYIVRPKDTAPQEQHAAYIRQLQAAFTQIAVLDAEVWVEDVFCRSRAGYRSLCMVRGELRMTALSLGGRPFQWVLASAWQPRVFKRLLNQSKRATGGQTKVYAKKAALHIDPMGMDGANEHECDACCIAYYAWMRVMGCFV